MKFLDNFKTAVVVTGLGMAGFVGFVAPASAYVVCNGEGDCWHTDHHWHYPGAGYVYHPDDWYFHRNWTDDRLHWREWHDGSNSWRNGVWIQF